MNSIFKAIPGIEMPVSEVVSAMADLWEGDPNSEHPAPSEFRASQMNFILHLGPTTSVEEATALFKAANNFAHSYPSRIIILCPTDSDDDETLLIGKLYAECYIGKTMRDMRCCEILTLGYRLDSSEFLEQQVSIWLESDLPTYYWSHRIPVDRLNTSYSSFILDCRRQVFDSSVEPEGFLKEINQSLQFHDLCFAKLLPVRQTLGQLLSAFEPAHIVEGLESVSLNSISAYRGEAGALASWVSHCLEQCYLETNSSRGVSVDVGIEEQSDGLCLVFNYESTKHLRFSINFSDSLIQVSGDMGRGLFEQVLKSGLMIPEAALAEAIFFNHQI